LSVKWKNYDESKIAEILSYLADEPRHFNEIFKEMKKRGVAGSKTTLSQYLNHLIEKNRIRKIVSPVKGKRVAYEIISQEDLKLAEQAKTANTQAELNREFEFHLNSWPSLDPLDPRAIHIFRRMYESQQLPGAEDFISKRVYQMTLTLLREMKIQLERYQDIKNSEEIENDRIWIESSFNRLKGMLRNEFAKVSLFLLAEHYTKEELTDAINKLYQEYNQKQQNLDVP
jgi:hypothetical protein